MMQSIVTVTDAASSYDLTTLANAKAELGITDSASDVALRRYISSASVAAANYCDRVFVVETVSEQFIPPQCYPYYSGEILQLARFPIIAVTSVTEDDTVLVEDTDFSVDYKTGRLVRLASDGVSISVWPIVSITVVYSAGYTTTPADLEDAVIRMVTQRYSAKGRDSSLRSEEIPGVRSATYWIATGAEAGNITPDVADVLNN